MRHHDPDLHLTGDELPRAMIDPSDLDPTRQAHFNACLHCRRQAEAWTAHYDSLGRMARQMAPEPGRPFRVPSLGAPVRRWPFKPVVALGVLGALIFVFALWGPEGSRISQTPAPMVVQNFENDDRLMEEVDTLVEDALPVKYQELAALSDDRSVEDLDAFIDWMVPSPGEADDGGPPSAPYWESLREPLARSEMTAHAERGMYET